MAKFTDKLLKNKKLKDIIKEESYNINEYFHSGSITLNLLLSGKVNGGVPKGPIMTMFAAPKAHYKTIIATIASANAQKKGSFVVWLDSEFAFNETTARMFGMKTDKDSLLVIRDNSIEEVQSILMNIFKEYDNKEDGDVLLVVDSLGTMITSKTIEDSIEGKDVADMTIAKKKNAFSKLLLRVSGKNNVPVVMINHLYEDMKQYSTGAIGGGSSAQYVSSSILKITSKRKEKDKDGDVSGNVFTCYTEKGRFSKENSKLQFLASYEEGINLFYGLLPDALEAGVVNIPTQGFYTRPCVKDDKKWRESQIYNKDFWLDIFKNTDFTKYLESKYSYDNSFEENKNYDTSNSIDIVD